jgi:F0F1-type ATP synthase delta subunit
MQEKNLCCKLSLFANKLGTTSVAFLDIIIRKGREMYLAGNLSGFYNQYKEFNKISTVTVTTAAPLNEWITGRDKG